MLERVRTYCKRVWCERAIRGLRLTLTHLPLVPHICVQISGQHLFRCWLVTYSAPSQYLYQCWVIVNWTLRNKLQWNFNQNTKHFVHENASKNIVCEMAAILYRGRWVNYHPLFRFRSWSNGMRRMSLCILMDRYRNASIHTPLPSMTTFKHIISILLLLETWGWFNKKIPSYQNRKFHCGDKIRWSYDHVICTMGFPILARRHLNIESVWHSCFSTFSFDITLKYHLRAYKYI